jgi:hypothetical protein
MTLHPWPLTATTPQARQPIVWKNPFAAANDARSLLIDSGAVPLCFAPDAAAQTAPTEADALLALQCRHDAALARIRLLEALLREHT